MRSITSPAFLLGNLLFSAAVSAAPAAASAPASPVTPVTPVIPTASLTPAASNPAGATARQAPVMRLGDAVLPLSYDLDLTIIPEQDDFRGKIVIELDIRQVQDFFWLNGNGLNIESAVLTANGKQLPAQVVSGQDDFIGLQFAAPLASGKASLSLTYQGKFSKTNTSGLFKQKDGADWYVLSQFESTSARRAFPCFDEPHWKTPWRIAITHKAQHVAASNMPRESVQDLPGGLKKEQFATTPPLPSYLLALGVGPFDVVDGGKAGRKGTPLRYFVPKGRAQEVRYAAQVTPKILAQAEDYFNSPYPFPKLDSMVIPITVNFGAMENVGLITYRSSILLAKPGQEAEDFKQKYVSIGAHEIAHQWFGDLVTMQWWDDIWLNESFATWMSAKLFKQFNPAWDSKIDQNKSHVQALEIDRLQSTRQIRQNVQQPDDLANAFDRITYEKGGAVLRMFETYLGAEKFQAGVQRYLKKHAFGNASAHDFFAALADSDPQLAQAFAGFVTQPGVPLLRMEIDCDKQPTLKVQQQRFLPGAVTNPLASVPAAQLVARQDWAVPLCIRYQGQTGSEPLCQMIKGAQSRIALPNCPAWVLPNARGEGYYLSTLPARQLTAIPSAAIEADAAIGLAGEMSLLAASGVLEWRDILPALARQGQDARPEVAWSALRALNRLQPEWLDEKGAIARAAWLQKQFGARARSLGWLSRAHDSDSTNRLRSELLPLLATQGRDSVLRAEVQQLALQWLTASASGQTPPDFGVMLRPILIAAGYQADQTMVDLMLQAAQQSQDARLRYLIFIGIGSVNDPAMRKQALLHMFDAGFDLRESNAILWQMAENGEASSDLLDFLQNKIELIKAKMPDRFEANLPRAGQAMCSAQVRDGFAQLFTERLKNIPGGSRNLAQALEAIDICVANRKKQAGAVQGFFSGN